MAVYLTIDFHSPILEPDTKPITPYNITELHFRSACTFAYVSVYLHGVYVVSAQYNGSFLPDTMLSESPTKSRKSPNMTPSPPEGLRVFEEMLMENISSLAYHVGETLWDQRITPRNRYCRRKTVITVEDYIRGAQILQYSMTLQKSTTCINSHIES